MTTANTTAVSGKRPVAVTILTWVLILSSLGSILIGALSIASFVIEFEGGKIVILNEDASDDVLTDQGELAFDGIWYSIVGIVQLVITIGFWRLKRWAWVAAMSWQALKLLVDVANGLAGSPEVVALVISILLVLLLNQSDVRRVFGIRRNTNESAPTPTLSTRDVN